MIDQRRPVRKREINRARTMVREIVRHHLGAAKVHTRYVDSGRTNFVFQVRHDGRELIVRINSDSEKLPVFLKEQWLVDRVRKVGVPSPEILEVGNEAVPWPYMISVKAAGRPAIYHWQRLKIVQELGAYAAVVNTVPTHGFGATFDWSKNMLSRHRTWPDFLSDELRLPERLRLLERHRLISKTTASELSTTLEGYNPGRPKLNHGDLRLKNVLVDKRGKIGTIIDWEHSVSNTICWDISVGLHDLSIDEKEKFLAGYGLGDKTLRRLAPVIKALNIINYAPALENLRGRDKSKLIRHWRTRLSGYLDLYSL